jgi:hypothetical protein
MSNRSFRRSVYVVKTHSEVSSDSPTPRAAVAQLFDHSITATSSPSSSALLADVQPKLTAIRQELEDLKRRRADLEAQRKRLLEERLLPHEGRSNSDRYLSSGTLGGMAKGVWPNSSLPSTYRYSEEGSLAAVSTAHSFSRQHYVDSTVVANMSVIPSEKSRLRHLKPTPQLGMKSAMRNAAAHDSTLLMGDFLPEDNPRACTFGRERRFRAVVGQRGKYYLSTDVGVEQLLNRDHLDTDTFRRMAQRFDQTPGPGAYTPRYNKVSRPPRFY